MDSVPQSNVTTFALSSNSILLLWLVGIVLQQQSTIDKLYTQIGNVNCLHNIIEPFAALF